LFDATGVARTKVNEVSAVKQKFPWSTWGALRYASRLAPRPSDSGNGELARSAGGRVHDAFEDERMDIELDVQYEMNARHRDLNIESLPGQVAEFQSTAGSVTMQAFPIHRCRRRAYRSVGRIRSRSGSAVVTTCCLGCLASVLVSTMKVGASIRVTYRSIFGPCTASGCMPACACASRARST
jgi:hypothetical protein